MSQHMRGLETLETATGPPSTQGQSQKATEFKYMDQNPNQVINSSSMAQITGSESPGPSVDTSLSAPSSSGPRSSSFEESSEYQDPPEWWIKHREYVRDNILCHMDWDGRVPLRPFRTFRPNWFLQPSQGRKFSLPELGAEVPAQTWANDGSHIYTTAVWIPSEEVENKLRDWAKQQGKHGRLSPCTYFVNGERSGGWKLTIDD